MMSVSLTASRNFAEARKSSKRLQSGMCCAFCEHTHASVNVIEKAVSGLMLARLALPARNSCPRSFLLAFQSAWLTQLVDRSREVVKTLCL